MDTYRLIESELLEFTSVSSDPSTISDFKITESDTEINYLDLFGCHLDTEYDSEVVWVCSSFQPMWEDGA